MHLKCKDWKRFWLKQCKGGTKGSYGNFRKVPQKLHFYKKCKEETKRSFSKIAQKVVLASNGQQHSGANVIIL